MIDLIDYYFAEQLNQYSTRNQFELGKVYSNPYARSFQPLIEAKSKKLRIFDFDDTLAKVKAKIVVKNNGQEFTLTPAEFAVYTAKPGDVFNFGDFNRVIKTAVPIQSNIKLLRKAAEDTNTKTTILTARMLAFPVKKYLKDKFNLDIYTVALGDANPQKKADYIEKEIKKGYMDIIFIDDSIKNVKAVEALRTKYPNVKLEIIHTKESEHLNF